MTRKDAAVATGCGCGCSRSRSENRTGPDLHTLPIIDFTNDDIAAFNPDENMDDNSPNSDSSGEWWWPENQLGLQQDNLDINGEIKIGRAHV